MIKDDDALYLNLPAALDNARQVLWRMLALHAERLFLSVRRTHPAAVPHW